MAMPPCDPISLAELLFIKEVQTDNSVFVAIRNSRPLLVESPLNTNDLSIGIFERRYVRKGEIGRYLLLQSHPGLGQIRATGKCGVDLELTYTEDTLEPARDRIRNRLAYDRRLTHLLKTLLRLRRLIGEQGWI